ncbi:MFS transporter [Streptomyces sp. NPDC050529]|uniref:MFS transporter n=1 Tax=Streptomyces sp. NPDC050529 TaxID=3365624 RepID=UPI003790A307
MAHGVFWSIVAGHAAALATPGRSGRTTAVVFAGNSTALVLGVPLSTVLGGFVGWRGAFCSAAALGLGALAAAQRLLRPARHHRPDGRLTGAARREQPTAATRRVSRVSMGRCLRRSAGSASPGRTRSLGTRHPTPMGVKPRLERVRVTAAGRRLFRRRGDRSGGSRTACP